MMLSIVSVEIITCDSLWRTDIEYIREEPVQFEQSVIGVR